MYTVTFELIHIARRADMGIVAETDSGLGYYTPDEAGLALDELAPGEAFVFRGMYPAREDFDSELATWHAAYDSGVFVAPVRG
jgi:hypothetical protein